MAKVRTKILNVYKNFKVNQIYVYYNLDKKLNQYTIKKFVFSPINTEHKTYIKDHTIQALNDFFKEFSLSFPIENNF